MTEWAWMWGVPNPASGNVDLEYDGSVHATAGEALADLVRDLSMAGDPRLVEAGRVLAETRPGSLVLSYPPYVCAVYEFSPDEQPGPAGESFIARHQAAIRHACKPKKGPKLW